LFSTQVEVRAVIFAAVMVTALAAVGMYQRFLRDNWLGHLARQAIGFVMGGIAVAFVFYVFPQLFIGRGVIGFALLLSFPIMAVGRYCFLRLVDIKALKRRVLVLGSGPNASKIVHRMRRRVDRRGFVVVGFVPVNGEEPMVPEDRLLPASGSLSELAERLQVTKSSSPPKTGAAACPCRTCWPASSAASTSPT